MKKITVLVLDDWEGVYIDGVLFDQNHHVDIWPVLNAVGQPYERSWVDKYYDLLCDKELDGFDEGYPFPEKLETWEKWCKECDDSNT